MFFSSALCSLKSSINVCLARGRTNSRGRPCEWKPRLQIEALEGRTLLSLFGLQTPFPAGFDPGSVVVGDFNRDGKLDLAVANISSNNPGGDQGTVSVLLGNGSGGLANAVSFPAGPFCFSLAVGDFNRDGNLDLVVTNNFDTGTVSVLLGNGLGGFGSPMTVAVGSNVDFVAVGDFNRDGNPDLAVTTSDATGSGAVSILLGDGFGGFEGPTSFSVGSQAGAVAVGDFNGDGNPDLVVANWANRAVSLLLGDGFGNFGPATSFPAGAQPSSVAVGDFDHDGKLDLAVANQLGNTRGTVSVLKGNGSGGFAQAVPFAAGNDPDSVVVGDFNRDGNPDLAVADQDKDNTVSVLLGDGSGGFGSPATFTVGSLPASVAAADFNGDGGLDLVVANPFSGTVSVLLNQASLTTTTLTSFDTAAVFGEQLSFKATVTAAEPDQPMPTGIVDFKDGQTVLGSGTLDTNGHAFFTTVALGVGYHPITAVYQGDPSFTGSTSATLNQLINQDLGLTTLTASANPAIAGQPIALTATVSADAPGSGTPTGTVLFEDGTTVLGSAVLLSPVGPISFISSPSAATASFSTTLAPGEHDLFAVYLGDGNFRTTSGFVSEVVNNPAPVLQSISPNSLPEGSRDFTLTLGGSNFVSGATVTWNGTVLANALLLSSTQIQVSVPASMLKVVGTASVMVANPGTGGLSLPQNFTITDALLTAYRFTLSVAGSMKFSGPVATFTDPDPGATRFNFAAIITWDNGTVTQGTVSAGQLAGTWVVSGTHTFSTFTNLHTIQVQILDGGGSTATVIDNVIDPKRSVFRNPAGALPTPVVNAGSAILTPNASTLTIHGFGFDTNPANDTVVFTSGATGTVTAATATQLTVTNLSGLGLGPVSVSVIVDGSVSGSAVHVATVIAQPPRFTSPATAAILVNQDGSITITTAGSRTASLTVLSGLPRFLTFHDIGDGTGSLQGTPTGVGTYRIRLRASDGAGHAAIQLLTLIVIPSPTTRPGTP
jgi:hypothetical protein